MLTLKGIYENGKVELLQAFKSDKKQSVLIVFLDEDDNEFMRKQSLEYSNENMDEFLGNINEDIYQDYLKKK